MNKVQFNEQMDKALAIMVEQVLVEAEQYATHADGHFDLNAYTAYVTGMQGAITALCNAIEKFAGTNN